jgi:2-keto-4-pentenoate hydratase/2-oxohepta-3-ene-1,7-dioic acid hydratase in catechol pathway
MRIGTLNTPTGPRAVIAVDGDRLVDVNATDPSLPADTVQLLKLGPDALRRAAAAAESPNAKSLPFEREKLGPAVTPGKLLCIGRNYAAHAAETGSQVPERPEVFVRTRTSITGPYASIPRPPVSEALDYEVELAVVIGRPAKRVKKEQALDYVAGYCVFNDVSLRDFQRHSTQWTPGKNFDATGPLGPFVVSADQVPDPQNLNLSTTVVKTDGSEEELQSSNTEDMVHTVADCIAYISQWATLEPGDVIATGTPQGVGLGRDPKRWLVPGETVICRVQGLGETRNLVVSEPGSNP